MKRILIIIGNMGLGGAETHIMKVYRAMDKQLYQFDFILNTLEKCYYEDEIMELGGKCYRVTAKAQSIVRNFFDIFRIVKKKHYNIVYKLGENALSWTEMLAACIGGAKIRMMRSTNTKLGGSISTLIHYCSRPILNWILTERIAPSKEAAEWLFGRRNVNKTFIMHNGVDTNYYRYNSERRKKTRENYSIPDDSIVLGHVGRFFEQKNHRFMIELLNQLVNKKEKQYFLLLVGDGPLQNQIIEYATDLNVNKYIIFCGNQKDTPGFYSAMDLFILPSFYEGLPNVVIEAQANGLSCLISDSVTRECDITGMCTFLSINDVNLWADQISSTKPKRTDSTVAFMNNGYDIKSVTDSYVKLFENGE